METLLEINKSNALKAFNEANDKGKVLLTNLFGKEVFNQKITDRVRSYEDACDILGIDPEDVSLDLPDHLESDRKSLEAYGKLVVIARVLNEGWKPDWTNSDEYKYFPWFKMTAGFGFSSTHYDSWYSLTSVGSRLCFKNSELAEFAGKQFQSIYNDYLTL